MIAAPSTFELQGEFLGFFRDFLCKRRMVLRIDGKEVFLKIPKALRHELEDVIHRGQSVVVTGSDSEDGRDGRVVMQVRVAGEAACVACPIRVCAKKTCWRNGGKELFRALEQKIEEAGLGDSVKLKAVDCLDHCKHGPNAQIGGHDFHRCTPRDAERLLEHLTGQAV
jgi:hypothetical protein